MSKYNLQDILNEYVGGSRHGTIKISYRDLQDAMDTIERQGDFVVRELPGPSGDGKTNREFEVVYIGNVRKSGKEEGGFTVYDYKFGFDPGDEMHFDEEYEFSIGGNNKRNALILARDLLGPAVKGYFGDDQKIVNSYTPQMANDVIMSLDRNMDDEGEMTDYAADVEIDSINEEEMSKSEKKKLKKVSSQLKKSVKAHDKQSKVIDKIVNEENVIKDLAMADEVIKMIKMMNPDVRQDLLMKLARMGQKMDENRREKNPVGMGQLYVQPAVQKEIKRQLDAYDKGDIDVDDLINGIEEIIFGYVKAPGMNESTGPSDKAETEDDVVNIDKVASPSAKGVGYGAETTANTAEDDMEDKEIANPRPMYEINYDAIDQAMKGGEFAKKLGKLKGTLDFKIGLEKLESALNKNKDISGEEALAAIGKELKMPEKDEVKENGDTEDFANELKENMYIDDDEFEMEMVMDRAKEIAPILKGVDMDIIVDFVKTHRQDIRGASDEEIRDEFEEFRSVNYDYIDEDLKNQFKRFM